MASSQLCLAWDGMFTAPAWAASSTGVPSENLVRRDGTPEVMLLERAMVAFLTWLLLVARSRPKSRARLEAENIVLRQQLIVLSRKSQARVTLRNTDRWLFVWLYRLFPSILDAVSIVKPETLIRWHRRGFRAYWRWKSRRFAVAARVSLLIVPYAP